MKADAKGEKDKPNIFFPDKFLMALELYFRYCEEEPKIIFQVPVEYVILRSIDRGCGGTD